MAIANNPPRSTAASILAMTLKWSVDQASENLRGKYASQKARKQTIHRALRDESATGGMSPMSRPTRLSAAERTRACSFLRS